ncbi:hypothetical protein [Robiginitalea sediminis]|nr:hypothetical protein [Robiginitalea sediminis]
MKKIGLLLLTALLCAGITGCTNDEGEPEFEILTPEEEQQAATQDA